MGSYRERKTYFRSVSVVLNDRDELALSRVFREFFPTVMFFDGDSSVASPTWISNLSYGTNDRCSIAVPAPGQETRWKLNTDTKTLMVHPTVRLDFDRSQWEWLNPERKWAFDLPLLGWGELTIGYPKDMPEIKPFAGRLLRLVNKITGKGGGFGLDASLWSQSGNAFGERRALGIGICVDPSETITLNKYYDDSLWDDQAPASPVWTRNIRPPDHFRRVSGD